MPCLTTKELSSIEDQLAIEGNLVKKYKMYAQQSTDSQIKCKFEEIASKHQNHYSTLLGHLS